MIDDCHFIVGTFSKTLGAIGGYCVSDEPDFDILRVTVRSYMFTASLPPSIVASVRQALRVVKAGPSCARSSGTMSPRSTTASPPRASSSVPSMGRWSACTCPTA